MPQALSFHADHGIFSTLLQSLESSLDKRRLVIAKALASISQSQDAGHQSDHALMTSENGREADHPIFF